MGVQHAILESVQVGLPVTRGSANEGPRGEWTSAIFKDPVEGDVWLGATNLAGDGQADAQYHGGRDKAVLAYSADCYPAWREELGLDLRPGAFGENFTISGMSERNVCIGDVYVIGGARVEVSQPRGPCWKLARKWELPGLTARVARTGRTGWYLRVLREGTVYAGMPVELAERPFPQWTVTRATGLAMHPRADAAQAEQLAACPALSDAWRVKLIPRNKK